LRPIRTNVPGIENSDLWPRLSQLTDRYALLRSVAHTGGGHPAGSLQVLAGDPNAQDKRGPRFPDWMSVGPGDFLATLYSHLGIDAHHVAFHDFNGRPTPIFQQPGSPIPELAARS
jgi:hypothetical protein